MGGRVGGGGVCVCVCKNPIFFQISNFHNHVKAKNLELSYDECDKPFLVISEHWFRWWLGVVRQQAIFEPMLTQIYVAIRRY